MAFGTLFTEQHLLNPGQHQGHYPETLPKCMQKPRSTPVLFLCCWHLRKTWCPLTLVTFFWIFFPEEGTAFAYSISYLFHKSRCVKDL